MLFGKSRYSLLLNSLLHLTDTTKERDCSIIRLFTFEALRLSHTCCRELSAAILGLRYADDIMDEEEIQSIQDEDQFCYRQLEQLFTKFHSWFYELGLPIMDFMSGPWHKYITGVLSSRDSYDEEHIFQTRDLGIFLEPTELEEVPEFFYLLGNQVEELEYEKAVSDDEDDDEHDEFDDETKNGRPASPV